MTRIGAPSLELNADRIREAYKRMRRRLLALPEFDRDAREAGVSALDIDRRMDRPPGDESELWEWLDGSDHYRFAGLFVFHEAFGGASATEVDGGVHLEGEVQIIAGDVHIRGDLVLTDAAMLMVLGELVVDGDIRAEDTDYSLVAAASVRCRNLVSWGEVLALSSIEVAGTVYLAGNDHSCRAPRMTAAVLVDFERGNVFGQVDAERHVTDWSFPEAASALGLDPDEDDLAGGFAARLDAERRA